MPRAKATDFKFGMHAPRQIPDMTSENNSRKKGACPGSHDAVLSGDMYCYERLLVKTAICSARQSGCKKRQGRVGAEDCNVPTQVLSSSILSGDARTSRQTTD